jgi:hypothetical protein
MSNINALNGKLQELSNRLTKKDQLGKDYKKIVSDSLARIKAKITKILADHNKRVQNITQGSAENLEKTRVELETQLQKAQKQSRDALDAANQAAKKTQDELQNNLNDRNAQLNTLQRELQQPNPDRQSMQVIIEKLRQDLQTATDASAATNAQIEQLNAKLVAYDGMRDKMDALIQQLFNKVGEILAQVDAMSINQVDITELLQLLSDTEELFSNDDNSGSGSDDEGGGGLFSGFFGSPSNNVRTNNRDAGGFGPKGAGGFGPGGLPKRESRKANTAPGQNPLDNPIPNYKNQSGGKTKRRRGKKTKYRGGYVNKPKSATRKRHKRPRTSKSHSRRISRRGSSTSSSV